MTTPIPCPPSLPFLGHITSIDKDLPLLSFSLLAQQYGEIYQFHQFSVKKVVVSSYELMHDVSDDKKFFKNIGGVLEQVRNGVGDGLVTARPDEENWGLAHRLLTPAFGAVGIRDMFDDMCDIATQLIVKWERFGPGAVINPAEDFTRLTFDTITLCAMSHRLNSFYRETNHPFVQAMVDFLLESGRRTFRPSVVTNVMGYNTKYEADIKVMTDLANDIIADRKKNPTEKNDLLNRMLNGKDPKTGKGLSDENIRYNLLTFLIAGHETTSSIATLSFTLYYLLKNPEAMRKLRQEVDEVLGDQPPQLQDLSKLTYLNACLRECLRLSPASPIRSVDARDDTVIGGGKYTIQKGQSVIITTGRAQRDPKIWGEDADEFKPERMLDGKFDQLPPHAWQPFGFGMRACIGRALAWQEMLILIPLILQRFDIAMENPSYELEIKQTLTIKPKEFHIRAAPRKGRAVPLAIPSSSLLQARRGDEKKPSKTTVPVQDTVSNTPVYVMYGSNTGTSETFAQRIASDAASYGFRASIGTLDSFTGKIPTDGPVVIITASFEGEPADNAAHFVEWITSLKGSELTNVSYGLFGCGNRDWYQSYQRIPTLIDRLLEERGGRRLVPRGVGDASAAEFFERYDDWQAQLWESLSQEYKTVVSQSPDIPRGLEMKTVDPGTFRASVLRQPDAALGTVVENTLLTKPGTSPKRHIVFELPEGMSTRAGDYLAILPSNPVRDVQRVIARFGLSGEQEIILSTTGPTPLPVNRPIGIFALLSGYVEISQPATTRDLNVLMSAENAPVDFLRELTSDYSGKVVARRLSILDILEDHSSMKLSFATYLHMLPSMRVRQYSISSSPLWDAQRVSLTVSVVDAPSIAGRKEGFLGVASTYLAGLRPGDKVQIAVRASATAFHPPADPTIPMVMFAAGSGLAPMRGFLQERAMQKKAGREVAKSLLFFGCRSPELDYLYSDSDLKEWIELGVVDVRPAFSRATELSHGCKYIQDRIWLDRADVNELYDKHAKFYTCGARRIAQGIKDVLSKMIMDRHNVNESEAEEMFERAIQGSWRYVRSSEPPMTNAPPALAFKLKLLIPLPVESLAPYPPQAQSEVERERWGERKDRGLPRATG
ncbi:uncharacterized protein FIBRA_07084 [Fibroporia radiculosa]|uniref:Cytochrome P450 n=1 Tax=Fibroporia radiculosa TaxID=599839 RepID=J4GDF6_9APHY|nr:uncharacterized protein FIBRA_07084 [Fibroporia radiculosa]CCM04888.1 predicted protein [Fibroporia radiculosa]